MVRATRIMEKELTKETMKSLWPRLMMIQVPK